ncbi:MAG: hypothetical protein ACOYS2_02150 [Patescibacteria group bacterium]
MTSGWKKIKGLFFVVIPILAIVLGGYFVYREYRSDSKKPVFSDEEVKRQGESLFPGFGKSSQKPESWPNERPLNLNDLMKAPVSPEEKETLLDKTKADETD